MAVYGLIVGKNEAHRYLEASLSWNVPLFDGVVYYDDRSTDESVEIATEAGCEVVLRQPDAPSFMAHEGRFRQNAFNVFSDRFRPLPDIDWVFSFDADEFIIGIDGKSTAMAMKEAIMVAMSIGAYSIRIPLPEIWSSTEEKTERRMDGFWGSIYCTRFFRWQGVGPMRDKAMGCGSEPLYVSQSPISRFASSLHLLHYGYADSTDLMEKYQRYSTIEHGHNNAHINSIVGKPHLMPWAHEVPHVYRGRQHTPKSDIGFHAG